MQKNGIRVFTLLALATTLGLPFASDAQTKPAPISCTTRKSLESPGDIALLHDDLVSAISLYRAESAASGEEGERTHNALIRALLLESKTAEAETEARAWLSKSPQDPWAKASIGEVQFARGELDEAGNSMRSAIALSFCNPQAHADYAAYLDFSGYHAGAKTQMEIAHRLDGIDNTITVRWIRYQPTASRGSAIDAYLTRAKSLTEAEHRSWQIERTALASASSSSCMQSTSVTNAVLPMYAIRDGSKTGGVASNVVWGLSISINGKRRRLQLDTAATGIVLKKASAVGLALESEGQSATQGFGTQAGMATTISSAAIKIGDMEFQNCHVEILEKDISFEGWGASRHFMEGQDGLIGIDVFRNFLMTLDYPGKVVKLAPLPHPSTNATSADDYEHMPQDPYIDSSMTSWTKAFRSGHQLFVPVRLNGKSPHLFLVDTGISTDMISTARAREVTSVERTNVLVNQDEGVPVITSGVGEVIGAGGLSEDVSKTHATGAVTLDFGGVRAPAHPLNAYDAGLTVDHMEITGALGSITLRQLTIQIDQRDQLIKFTFDPSRISKCVNNVTIDDCY